MKMMLKTYSSEYLFERYLTSVGRNANLLIGCVPDRNGLISEDQVESFVALGNLVNSRLNVHIGMSSEMLDNEKMEVWFDNPVDVSYVEIMEDQTDGQKILEWVLETRWPAYWCSKDKKDQWIPVAQGNSIGHKRIISVNHLRGYAFRVRILTYLLVIGVIGGILYFVVKAAVKEGMLDALEEWHKEHDGDSSF